MTDHAPQGHWRPNLYPAQSYSSPRYDPNQALEKEELPPIPAAIRAVQQASTSDSCSRTLVICLDGTGDKFDNDNSNVVNFVACLKKDSPSQITYYQSGIGTYDGHGLSRGFSAAVDMAVGSGLGIHIKDAYRFIMQNYNEGDKICLFGFSRGSYTARCLAGMLHKVGLLPAGNEAQVSFAYKFYKDDTLEGWKLSTEFKQTFCTNVTVYFVGVWDCVASVGFFPRLLPFSKSPTNTINHFRHAMALDEHRAKFKCCQWAKAEQGSDAEILAAQADAEHHLASSTSGRIISSRTKAQKKFFKKAPKHDKNDLGLLAQQYEKGRQIEKEHIHSDVLEVWFAGAHCDVGGGAVPNTTRHMLSRIPLRWMIRQCFDCNTGIIFDTTALADVGIDIHTVWPIYIPNNVPIVGPSPKAMEHFESGSLPPIQRRSSALIKDQREKQQRKDSKWSERTDDEKALFVEDDFSAEEKRLLELLPEQVEDHFDALQPVNDMLEQAKGWWILEIMPIKMKVKKSTDEWEKKLTVNLGRYRPIQEIEPKMHWTVKLRLEREGCNLKNDITESAQWNITA